jgi:hypothetical protein
VAFEYWFLRELNYCVRVRVSPGCYVARTCAEDERLRIIPMNVSKVKLSALLLGGVKNEGKDVKLVQIRQIGLRGMGWDNDLPQDIPNIIQKIVFNCHIRQPPSAGLPTTTAAWQDAPFATALSE